MMGCLRFVGLASSDVSPLTPAMDDKWTDGSGALVFKLVRALLSLKFKRLHSK